MRNFCHALSLSISVTLCGSVSAGFVRGDAREEVGSLKSAFRLWIEEFDKQYETADEKLERMLIWVENNEFIDEHNKQIPLPSYTLGHNQFSDLTFDEFRGMHFLGEHSSRSKMPDKKKVLRLPVNDPLDKKKSPKSVDWTKNGAVTNVKNQGICGSCWAFSAIGAIEGARFLDTGKLTSLSVQEIVDCDKDDHACSGGYMDNAFKWDMHSGGICSEESYPYVGIKGWFNRCEPRKSECDVIDHTEVDYFIDVNHTHVHLKKAISKQPVSVGIEADQQGFQFYKSGVFDDPDCGVNVDHGVLAVGYGTEDNTDFYLIKNSWGATWGDNGFIKISRKNPNNGKNEGQCGILTYASRPTLKDNEQNPKVSADMLRSQ